MAGINFTLGINTKLDAVNYALAAIGSVGVSSEDEIEDDVDAAMASLIIEEVSQQIQTNSGKGLWFNKESFHKLLPDQTTGRVSVPQNTISCYLPKQNGKVITIALRGNVLFDPVNYGYDLRSLVNSSGVLPCTLVVVLPYAEIPTTVKQAVADFGRFWLVHNLEGDQVKMGPLKTAAEASLISVKSEDATQRRRSMFDNPSIANAVQQIGGYNNN